MLQSALGSIFGNCKNAETGAQCGVAQTILVVEDELLVRLDTADYLEGCGYTVLQASDASDAITLIRARSDIDVVFTDVRMPGQPGPGAMDH